MQRPAVCLLLLTSLLAACAPQPAAAPVEKLADNVYLYTDATHRSLFVTTEEGVLVTDPLSGAAAQRYLQAVRTVSDAPIQFMVYSHYHGDHVSGGAAFGPDVTIIGHDNVVSLIAPDSDIVAPTVTFSEEVSLHLGSLEVELIYPGPSETDSSIIVFIPARRVAFMVDAVSVRTLPWKTLDGADPYAWIAALERLDALDFDILAPGHGPTGEKAHVREYINYMSDLTAAVKEQVELGSDLETTQNNVDLSAYADWVRYEEHLVLNIEGVYRELQGR